ncbi:MAG: nucleotide exchange factor GrpE [Proteobacteria bacterium]|nr:nucleotide exchange factor GrpE [Pseudomonadota bacterium]
MINEEPTKDGKQIPTQGDADRSGHSDPKEILPQETQTPLFETMEDTERKPGSPASGASDTAALMFKEERLQTILDLCQCFQNQLHNAEKATGEMKRGQELLAAKLRELSDKLDDITSSFSEPRIRDLLTSLLLLHDLVDQMAGGAADKKSSMDHERNYGVLLSQIYQILGLHGIQIIPTDVRFDENLHRAIRTMETDDPSQDGRIVQVFQTGFRSQRRILRYANVEVMTLAHHAGEGEQTKDVSDDVRETK